MLLYNIYGCVIKRIKSILKNLFLVIHIKLNKYLYMRCHIGHIMARRYVSRGINFEKKHLDFFKDNMIDSSKLVRSLIDSIMSNEDKKTIKEKKVAVNE